LCRGRKTEVVLIAAIKRPIGRSQSSVVNGGTGAWVTR
jgi:hypothetical protein